jgi:hypothetical protein
MKSRILLPCAALLAAAALYASPYLAVYNIKSAAQASDGAKLAGYVDFPAVKDSIKAGFQDKLARRGESAFGAAVAGALLGPMVDALITPESLARIVQGQKPLRAAARGRQSGPGSEAAPAGGLESGLGYESLNLFVFTVKRSGDSGEPMALVFRRERLLRWKLVALRLP